MTIIHAIKLIPAKFRWFGIFLSKTKMAFKRIKTILILEKLREKLVEKRLIKERINNEATLKEAYGIQCQLDLIDFLLGGKDVL